MRFARVTNYAKLNSVEVNVLIYKAMTFPKDLIPFLLVIVVLAPAGALFVFLLTKPIAGFKPSYKSALLSTGLGYFAVGLVSFLAQLAGYNEKSLVGALSRFICSVMAMSCSHVWLLRGPNKERATGGKALAITGVQIAGGFFVLIAMGLVFNMFFRK